ncbi:MAG: hAT transposon family protein [Colwellia sp.]|nr:hAT transposon family protein [Colwellia sp.]
MTRIAIKVLSVPTSSAANERVWSVFSLIHAKKRCRLNNTTVNQLAYVYVNSQLLSDLSPEKVY